MGERDEGEQGAGGGGGGGERGEGGGVRNDAITLLYHGLHRGTTL